MHTAYSLAELAALPGAQQSSVVTIGNFDGVHLGHQAVIAEVRSRAREGNARSVVITFDPHPSQVLQSANAAQRQLITPLPEKLELLAQAGVDLTLVLPFTDELRTLSARQFAETILCNALHAKEIHEGETFRFGHQAEADVHALARLGLEFRFSVRAYEPILRRGAPVSSSRIRERIRAGDVSTARALLGRPFRLQSTPAAGRGYGTRYAVPTINLATPEEILPGNGVYVTALRVGRGEQAMQFRGVTNAGNRPTFGADSYAIETHLFEFEPLPLSEETPLQLSFLYRLRDERRFASPEELKRQIGLDISRAQRFLALCGPLRV